MTEKIDPIVAMPVKIINLVDLGNKVLYRSIIRAEDKRHI
tara:strand:- start:20 stop:139 length:120 start_codon:yes stop_codon:yes gene_type:complete